VFEAFNAGAPQITTNDRFTRHIRADGGVKWDDVLAEPGWSQSQRVLISIAAALCADARRPRADSART
jgi:alkylhydroperoxidase/carboxymuconolactone decarboxylase family protein YurZ